MKRFQIVALLVFTSVLLLSITSCNKESNCEEHELSPCNEDPTKVNIRIQNVSEYDYCNLIVNPYNEDSNCGKIKAGEYTCYRSYDVAYGYGYIKLNIGEKEFILCPFDYVGEVPLDPGYYTYSIDVPNVNDNDINRELN